MDALNSYGVGMIGALALLGAFLHDIEKMFDEALAIEEMLEEAFPPTKFPWMEKWFATGRVVIYRFDN